MPIAHHCRDRWLGSASCVAAACVQHTNLPFRLIMSTTSAPVPPSESLCPHSGRAVASDYPARPSSLQYARREPATGPGRLQRRTSRGGGTRTAEGVLTWRNDSGARSAVPWVERTSSRDLGLLFVLSWGGLFGGHTPRTWWAKRYHVLASIHSLTAKTCPPPHLACILWLEMLDIRRQKSILSDNIRTPTQVRPAW